MKTVNCFFTSLFVMLACVCYAFGMQQMVSGEATLKVIKLEKEFGLIFEFQNKEVLLMEQGAPIQLEIDDQPLSVYYSSCEFVENRLNCRGIIKTDGGSVFIVNDCYSATLNGTFELQRKISIDTPSQKDSYFNSFFGFATGNKSQFKEYEFFVPAVWYKNNFEPIGNIPKGIPQADDTCFLYRADRITLPVVMFREPNSGFTLSIIHKDSNPRTVVADSKSVRSDAGYQFGSIGANKSKEQVQTLFAYPGTEKDRRAGRGFRSHPITKELQHEYNLEITFSNHSNYADALKQSWERAVELYDPQIHKVNLDIAYDGLLETLLTYYQPSTRLGGKYDEPGLPFQVSLKDFKPVGVNYQMGFVGMQVATGYYLYREGVETGDTSTAIKGKDVLDFWANRSLTAVGYPRSWYDPKTDGTSGTFRKNGALRTVTGGMESLVAAWSFAKRNGISQPDWIYACTRFGYWLVNNQNADGSWFFEYDHTKISEGMHGTHPVKNDNKYLTVCGIRYLVELHIATGVPEFRKAAIRAGDFCLQNMHDKYAYVANVIDNPQTIDSESGQMAMNGFLALYDLTGHKKWLDAAEQAATYTETWVYMYNIPVEDDRPDPLVMPRDKSVVGQHIIAIGHPGSDLGFTWNSFNYYRLYLETGNKRYLKIARIAAHNTKQTLNWDGTLYPNQPKGLQLEAFRIMIPRRAQGVETTLNWSYAAHLDPMFRFKDAFGTPDLEAVERLPFNEIMKMNEQYSKVQSANTNTEELKN